MSAKWRQYNSSYGIPVSFMTEKEAKAFIERNGLLNARAVHREIPGSPYARRMWHWTVDVLR
jgi:hypothetical protein